MPHPESRPAVLRGDEGDLYRELQPRVRRLVARNVNTDPETIDDACQRAWMILMRRQPDRERVSNWLIKVAIREAIHLDRARRRERPASSLRRPHMKDETGSEDLLDLIHDPRLDIEQRLELDAALACLAELPPRKRRIYALRMLGLTYAEVAEQTGDTARTVERQMLRAKHIVELQRLLEDDHPDEVLEERLKPAARAALRRARRQADRAAKLRGGGGGGLDQLS